jgi:hypothetical protein
MTIADDDLAAVCWVRAVEQGPRRGAAGSEGATAGAPWSDDDASWASGEARRAVGEGGELAKQQAFVVQRARLAARRLAQHDAAWAAPGQGKPPRAWRWLIVAAAVAIAAWIVGNVLGGHSRINLLAPPVLGLLLWNLLVYGLPAVAPGRGFAAVFARALEDARNRVAQRGAAAPLLAARARFAAEWAVAARGVQRLRVATVLHGAAALLALLVIASMYVFGLAFDYRAGWDSTWLDAERVQRTLAFVFTPATALSGLEVPPIEVMAKLRFAEGSAGESAARWIHLYAITLALFVVLPRVLLAAGAAWRARRAADSRTLPLTEPYFRALLRDGPAVARPVTVLPYSYTLAAPQVKALPKALADAIGPGAQPHVKPSLPLGAEDALPAAALEDVQGDVAALFAASATPERETHGAFVRALIRELDGRAAVSVLVDESSMRLRTLGMSDADLRLTQRRVSWQRMLHDLSLPAPRFVDLS